MRAHFVLCTVCLLVGCGQYTNQPSQATRPVNPDLAHTAAASLEPATQVDNPEYINWSQFPVGTTVLKRKEVRNEAGTVTVETELRLTEKSANKVVVESQVTVKRPDMPIQDNPALPMEFAAKFPLPAGMSLEQFELPSLKAKRTGEELVKVGGDEYPAELFEWEEVNEAGPMTVKVWRSAKVPGRVLRQETFVKQTKEASVEQVHQITAPKSNDSSKAIEGSSKAIDEDRKS